MTKDLSSSSPVTGEPLRTYSEPLYARWLYKNFEVSTAEDETQRYKNLTSELVGQFRTSEFWTAFIRELSALHRETEARLEFTLLPSDDYQPTVVAKPWKSAVNKSWRINHLNNKSFPDPPPNSFGDSVWSLPENWLTTMRDIVRTTVVVRYLDGVHIVRTLIEQVASSVGLDQPIFSYEARHEGYYAVHITISLPLPYKVDRWKFSSEVVPIEIQLCTQIQEVLRTLTHVHYVERRNGARRSAAEWTWDDESPEFIPNFLGHILHYADGMIVGVRKNRNINLMGGA